MDKQKEDFDITIEEAFINLPVSDAEIDLISAALPDLLESFTQMDGE